VGLQYFFENVPTYIVIVLYSLANVNQFVLLTFQLRIELHFVMMTVIWVQPHETGFRALLFFRSRCQISIQNIIKCCHVPSIDNSIIMNSLNNKKI